MSTAGWIIFGSIAGLFCGQLVLMYGVLWYYDRRRDPEPIESEKGKDQ